MKIPIICEYECVNRGSAINIVSGIPEEDLDLFYEDYYGSDESDICRICRILSDSFLIFGTFSEKELIKRLQEKSGFDDDTVMTLVDDILKDKKMIVRKAIIDGQRIYEKSPDFSKILKEQNLPEEQVKAIESLFATDTNTYVQKADR